MAAILFLAVTCSAAGLYILVQQRLSLPTYDRYRMKAEFQNVNGLNPGLGQGVNVAGVRVGTINDTELRDGLAVVDFEIDPEKLPRIYKDASAILVPNTPLKDMQVQIIPGTKAAGELKHDSTIRVARTTPPVDSDEVLAALDTDTRDFFELLIGEGAAATRGRGQDARELFKALGPTVQQTKEITGALAGRRRELARLVHNLAILSEATSEKDTELAQVVTAANATLGAMASQEAALRESVSLLPGTLSAARRSLANGADLARELRPALDALLPTVRRLPDTLDELSPLLRETEPVLRTQLRPLVREIQPLVRNLAPATKELTAVTPSLTSAFRVLNYTVNELAYNPPGDNEGFLFWLGWFVHNGSSFLSTGDKHGATWRGLPLFSCSSLGTNPQVIPLLNTLLGSTPTCP